MRVLTKPESRSLPWILAAAVLMSTLPTVTGCSRGEDQPATAPSASASPSVAATAAPAAPASPAAAVLPGPPPGAATAQQLQELVSPIALYPDVLIAQILAASTYPPQVEEANQWLKEHPNLSGDQLAAGVNPQTWDPSVKSLTQFPPVLQTMTDNLAWTSALGEAYYNQPVDVMNAIQVLRNMAVNAGTLKSTPQQKVEVQPAQPAAQGGGEQPAVQQTVIVQPAQPNTVYVPQYNPSTVYGAPVQSPPGYTGSEMAVASVLSFGVGMLLGAAINGNNNDWNTNWHSGSVNYNNNVYVSKTNVVPARYPAGAYPRPPYAGGAYPRPVPYPGARPPYNGGGAYNRPNNGAIPATLPYNPATARPYAANNPNVTKPSFPKPSTLPNNLGGSNPNGKNVAKNRPNQPANPVAANRPEAVKPANRTADPARGFSKAGGSTGGRSSALGGYEPGGNARVASARGQSSLKPNQGGLGGGRKGFGGGGNANQGNGGGERGGGNRGGGGGRGGRRNQ
jgi:hypothetical protein